MSENNEGFNVNIDVFDEKEKPAACKNMKKEIFEWFQIFSVVIILVVFIFTFVFKIATIEGPSMQNTLFKNEKIIISNFLYKPKYGDIVVISRNKENSVLYNSNRDKLPIIKRVIATEGQLVDIDFAKGIVYVDGKALDEKYVRTPTNLKFDIDFPVIVDKGCVFVMGDNRNNSLDSRSSEIGMIDTRYILGHALFRVFPFNKLGGLN